MRRWPAVVALIILLLLAAAAAFFFLPEPRVKATLSPGAPKGQALIARGEYLARAADCFSCHTTAGGQPYAGGVPFKLPFGTIYAPNITPDKATGIGDWSDADFARAMRRGAGKHGEMLYPAFPYASYALMPTDDVLAVKAYLFSLPPIRATAPQNTLSFPYNQRYLMRAWRLLFVPGHHFQPDQSKSPQWNRGAYLVEALGHCGDCHTPRNLLFGLDNGRKFAGAITAGWTAYNISSDAKTGIGAWSGAQIASYLSRGHAPGRSSAAGPMAEAVENSLHYLTEQDIAAMVTYLKTVPPQQSEESAAVDLNPPAAKAPNAYEPIMQANAGGSLGQHIFEQACASCHGWNGQGLQTPEAGLIGNHTVNDPKGTNLLQVVLHGAQISTAQGEASMPAFGEAYSDVELAALSNYVIAQFGGKKAGITAADVARARE
jgi:mono/diheme cytochrome c family protein